MKLLSNQLKMINLYDEFDGHFEMHLVSIQDSFEQWEKNNSKPPWFHNEVRILSVRKNRQ